MGKTVKKVLILCTGNSCRSQMAEAMVNHYLGDKWQAFSAGVEPADKVSPYSVVVMKEMGIDISKNKPKPAEDFLSRDDLDLVITVCDHAKETCPVFPQSVQQIHIGFEDPGAYKDRPPEITLPKYREIRDKIKAELVDKLARMQ